MPAPKRRLHPLSHAMGLANKAKADFIATAKADVMAASKAAKHMLGKAIKPLRKPY